MFGRQTSELSSKKNWDTASFPPPPRENLFFF